MNEEIEFRHLRYFLAVADTLHFSKAAERLGMAQPPLSQQIKRLEQIVGHRLFDRTTRGVRLTLAGQLLAERARTTMEKVHDDLAQVRRLGRGEAGTLTVGFSGSVMFTALPIAIESYRRFYPKVELRLREMVTSAQIPALLDGTLDLAFLRDGDGAEGIKMTTLLKEHYVAVLPQVIRLPANAHYASRICATSPSSSLRAGWDHLPSTERWPAAKPADFAPTLSRKRRSGPHSSGWWAPGWAYLSPRPASRRSPYPERFIAMCMRHAERVSTWASSPGRTKSFLVIS